METRDFFKLRLKEDVNGRDDGQYANKRCHMIVILTAFTLASTIYNYMQSMKNKSLKMLANDYNIISI